MLGEINFWNFLPNCKTDKGRNNYHHHKYYHKKSFANITLKMEYKDKYKTEQKT